MPDSAENVTLIEPSRGGIPGALSERPSHRERLYFLAWRDVKIKPCEFIVFPVRGRRS